MCIHPEERNLPILLLRFNRFSNPMCHNDFLNVSMLNSIKECIFCSIIFDTTCVSMIFTTYHYQDLNCQFRRKINEIVLKMV